MISVLSSSVVDRRSSQTKDYNINIYSFSGKHATLRSKNKDLLARSRNQNNLSEWRDMSIRGLLFQ